MGRRKRAKKHGLLKHVSRSLLLCASLCLVWLFVMVVVGWYNPRFHLIATFSSALLATAGLGGGVLERLVN